MASREAIAPFAVLGARTKEVIRVRIPRRDPGREKKDAMAVEGGEVIARETMPRFYA